MIKMKIAEDIILTENLFNLEKSIKVHRRCAHKIKKGACYHNVFYVSSEFAGEFSTLDWKIAYGYFSTFGNIQIRHCYILDAHNEVIDPTYIELHGEEPEDIPTYHTLETFNFNQYLSKLSKYSGDPSLRKYFAKRQQQIIMWGLEQEPRYAFLDDNF